MTSEAPDPREPLGRIVHEQRVALDSKIAAAEGRQRFNLGDWKDRTAGQRELDMRIGSAVADAVREQIAARLQALADDALQAAGGYPKPVLDLNSEGGAWISETARAEALDLAVKVAKGEVGGEGLAP